MGDAQAEHGGKLPLAKKREIVPGLALTNEKLPALLADDGVRAETAHVGQHRRAELRGGKESGGAALGGKDSHKEAVLTSAGNFEESEPVPAFYTASWRDTVSPNEKSTGQEDTS